MSEVKPRQTDDVRWGQVAGPQPLESVRRGQHPPDPWPRYPIQGVQLERTRRFVRLLFANLHLTALRGLPGHELIAQRQGSRELESAGVAMVKVAQQTS